MSPACVQDAFILAFHSPMDAAAFAAETQAALMHADWPQQLLQHEQVSLRPAAMTGRSLAELNNYCATFHNLETMFI